MKMAVPLTLFYQNIIEIEIIKHKSQAINQKSQTINYKLLTIKHNT